MSRLSRTDEFREWLIGQIPLAEQDMQSSAKLGSLDLPKILLTYLNWVGRLIPPRPRRWVDAWQWDGMPGIEVDNLLFHGASIEDLRSKIQSGEDVNDYLSRKTKIGYQHTESKGWASRKGGDKDFILNTYGLHHIHLKKQKEN